MKLTTSSLHSVIRESLNKKVIEITKKQLKGKVVHFDSDSTCMMHDNNRLVRDNSGNIQINYIHFYPNNIVRVYYYKIDGNVNILMIDKYIRKFLSKYFNLSVKDVEIIKLLRQR